MDGVLRRGHWQQQGGALDDRRARLLEISGRLPKIASWEANGRQGDEKERSSRYAVHFSDRPPRRLATKSQQVAIDCPGTAAARLCAHRPSVTPEEVYVIEANPIVLEQKSEFARALGSRGSSIRR